MANIGDLMMRVVADMKGFSTTVTKEAEKTGDKAGAGLGKSMNKSLKGQLGTGFVQGLGIGGALGVVGALEMGTRALTDAIFGSIDAASDQREAMSLAGQVFEENTDQMADWADGAADAFGQSKTEALNFASSFGTALKNVGFSLDETADKSQDLTRLAADLGSAFNASSEEAAIALRSGLLGESEPLRRFGVFLSEAAVKSKAAQMGMKAVNGQLTNGQKVAARYAIIMEQTADSQGMFGRDTNSLADAQKRLTAEVENLQAEVGTALVPIMVELAKTLNDDVVPAARDFFGWLSDLNEQVEQFSPSGRKASEGSTLFGQALEEVGKQIGILIDDSGDVLTFWDGWTLKSHEASDGTKNMASALKDDLASAANSVQGPLGSAADATDDLEDSQFDAAKAARDLTRALLDQVNTLVDEYYRPLELEDTIADNKKKLREAQAVLRSKKANAEQREDARDTIRELSKENEKAALELIATGDMSDKQFKGFIRDLDRQIKSATGDAKRHLQAVRREALRLNNLRIYINFVHRVRTEGIGAQIHAGGMQHGGDLMAGEATVVGEVRPELFVPDVPGHVYPSVESGLRALEERGDGTVVHLQTYGLPLRAETPLEVALQLRRVGSGNLQPYRPAGWSRTE
jgi:hypothetical protein